MCETGYSSLDKQRQSLRILVIAPTPFFADRGCHVRILEEVRTLMARGHRVTICTYHHGRDIEGIETQRSLKIPWYSKESAGPSIHKFYVDLLLLATVIWNGKKCKTDLIHAHLHEGIVIGKIASFILGIPLVADLQGSLSGELVQHRFFKQRGILHRMFLWMERIIIRLPDKILVSSTFTLPGLSESTSQVCSNMTMIRDGVDTTCFSRNFPDTEMKKKLGISPSDKIVGYLGVLTDYQGVPILLQAIPKVLQDQRGVHFLIMGYPNVAYYKEQAKALGIGDHVTFTGRIQYEDAPRYLGICDLAVSPKLNSTEANGKLLNYMAMSLPVVASDTQVNRDVLGSSGIYFAVGDPIELAQAISRVLVDEQFSIRLGTQLRDRVVNEFSWTAIGNRIIESYREVLCNPPKSKSQKVAGRSL